MSDIAQKQDNVEELGEPSSASRWVTPFPELHAYF